MNLRPLFLAPLIAVVLAAGTFTAGTRLAEADGSGLGAIEEAARELQATAVRPISEEDLVRAAIEGMLSVLDDPYAAALSPEERRQINDLVEGAIVGIGVWLRPGEAGLRITGLVEDSPAERSGLRVGDVIVEVNGRSVEGATLPEAAELIQGPVGGTVTLLVRRGGSDSTYELERERIEVDDVEWRLLPSGAGYARLRQFGRGAGEDVRDAIGELLDDGAEGVVLDLRGNMGGLAEEAVEVAGLFLDGGVVARFRERGAPEEEVLADEGTVGSFPLVVLVDGSTASASELVAGALQDRGRATIVGLTTFGKGSVLAVRDLEGTRIQYTTAFFLTPDGRMIEERGIVPDVRVLPGGPGDRQLDRAVEVLGA